jgi:hypothetical protein
MRDVPFYFLLYYIFIFFIDTVHVFNGSSSHEDAVFVAVNAALFVLNLSTRQNLFSASLPRLFYPGANFPQ